MDQVGELQRMRARMLLRRAEMDIELDSMDALISELTGEDKSTGCTHQDRKRITGMGADHDTFYCPDCGAQFDVPFPVEEN